MDLSFFGTMGSKTYNYNQLTTMSIPINPHITPIQTSNYHSSKRSSHINRVVKGGIKSKLESDHKMMKPVTVDQSNQAIATNGKASIWSDHQMTKGPNNNLEIQLLNGKDQSLLLDLKKTSRKDSLEGISQGDNDVIIDPLTSKVHVNGRSSLSSNANYMSNNKHVSVKESHLSSACLCLTQELLPNLLHQHSDLNEYMACLQGFDSLESLSSHQQEQSCGRGIVPFLKDKSIFITGATGFLAKVLVEKILRVQPNVKHLYLLIKAKDARGAKRRLKEEILGSNLFKFLQCRHGEKYDEFMEGKVSAVVGDISKERLGMDPSTFTSLATKLDIIVNSAATTTFDERYDYALNLNTKGPQRIMEFAKSCQHLQLVMHVSTAFVNGKRKGLLHEKTFRCGYSIANETLESEENIYPDIDVDLESKLIKEKMDYLKEVGSTLENLPSCISLGEHQKEKILTLAMKELGMERANNFGWQDTYVFTKAMGEMVIDSMRGHLPTTIIRPSVVESSFREPFPGWMEGNRMMDPIIISYGKGQLPGFLVDPKSVLDVVPVDMVANAMLAAMVEHACKPGLEVYQVASSVVNPLVFSNLARLSEEHFKEDPFLDNVGKPIETFKLQLYEDMDSFMEALSQLDLEFKDKFQSAACNPKFFKRYQQLALKVKEQATYLANLYRPYTFYAGRFDTSKTQRLFANLSAKEKQLFGFNVNDIDWETYIKRIHIPGLRKHVLKGRGSNM